MPYGNNKSDIKISNVNYLGRDFTNLKSSLIDYAKSYFPNSYKDFNETSPGMMLIEMSAYVGDVTSYYIDQQYREMMLPLAEERRNLVTLAKSYGYKLKPISPSYTELTLTQLVDADEVGNPVYADLLTIDKSLQGVSTQNSNVIFETLDIVDFTVSSSIDPEPTVTSVDDSTGIASQYSFSRKVRAVSGETKSKSFDISTPQKFLKLTLPETNVIEVLSCVDSNGNIWHEVNNLSEDKVPLEKHYTSDENRETAYYNIDGSVSEIPTPYSLLYTKVSKKFVVEVDEDNATSLVFGNGLLRNGQSFQTTFLAIEQQGINLPGTEENLDASINPLLGDAYGTLGEAPSQTTLTITYRVGGGMNSNVPVGDIQTIDNITTIPAGEDTANVSITNNVPALGGSSGETNEEIRYRTIGHISTQNRCVTKEDYEARVLNMPAKFGNIAKVYATRGGAVRNSERQRLTDLVDIVVEVIQTQYTLYDSNTPAADALIQIDRIKELLDIDKEGGLTTDDFNSLYDALAMAYTNISQNDRLSTIDLYILSYNNKKELVNSSHIIKQNLKKYLSEFRMLTDQITFYDGYIINFGVVFDVIAQPYENKDEVKFKCIQKIKDYFKPENMFFKQILYTNAIENLLMEIDGVRVVNYVTITQDFDHQSFDIDGNPTAIFKPALYTNVINSNNQITTTDREGYGYYYNFGDFYGASSKAGKGVILPSYEPSVFELKNPNENIKGIVR